MREMEKKELIYKSYTSHAQPPKQRPAPRNGSTTAVLRCFYWLVSGWICHHQGQSAPFIFTIYLYFIYIYIYIFLYSSYSIYYLFIIDLSILPIFYSILFHSSIPPTETHCNSTTHEPRPAAPPPAPPT
jgi:hypothetical protein